MDFLLDEDSVLERVDEYTLYCHYLGYQPDIKVNYTSPLRDDDDTPSFGIYPSKFKLREYSWKDSGGTGCSGDIYGLVQRMYGYTNRYDALLRVMSDFGLGDEVEQREKIVQHIPVIRNNCDIRVWTKDFLPEDIAFWNQFNINQDILQRFRVARLFAYWRHKSQESPIFTSGLAYVYRMYAKYQLYFPNQKKEYKFRNDLTEDIVMGVEQLSSTDTLIITKSYKDVMCLASYGYEAVSPRSENVPMPAGAYDYFKARYKHIYVMFDNDMKHRGEWYPFPKIYIPLSTGSKDISDFTRDYSPQAAAELMKQLVKH